MVTGCGAGMAWTMHRKGQAARCAQLFVRDRHCQVGVRGLLADRSVGGVINTGWMVRLVVHSMLGLDHLTR